MSDLSLGDIQGFVDAFRQPEKQGSTGPGNNTLNMWQGTVTAVSGNTATVKIRGVDIPGIRTMTNVVAGNVVWGLEQGNIKILLGAMRTGGLRTSQVIGYWVKANTSTTDFIDVDTTEKDLTYFGLAVGPVPAGRLIRARYSIWALGSLSSPLSQREWYFPLQTSEGAGGARTYRDERRHNVVGDAGPSFMPEFMFATEANYSNLVLWLRCKVVAGTGRIYLSGGPSGWQHSYYTVEDIGPA